jgi:hypothetical protein
MFAVVIEECDGLLRRTMVRTMVQAFAVHSDLGYLDIDIGWGGPSVPWQHVDRSRMSRSMLEHAVLSAVNRRRCIVGLNAARGASINVGETFATACHGHNDLTVETTHELAVLSARRLAKRDLWLAWYREVGVSVILAHEDRDAIEAATGDCGCLFTTRLQMYLLPRGKAVVYEMGTRVAKTIDATEEKTTST